MYQDLPTEAVLPALTTCAGASATCRSFTRPQLSTCRPCRPPGSPPCPSTRATLWLTGLTPSSCGLENQRGKGTDRSLCGHQHSSQLASRRSSATKPPGGLGFRGLLGRADAA